MNFIYFLHLNPKPNKNKNNGVFIKLIKIIVGILLGFTFIFLMLKWFLISDHYVYYIRWVKMNQAQNHVDCPQTYLLKEKQSGLRNQYWLVKYPHFYSLNIELELKVPDHHQVCIYKSAGQL